MSVEAVLFDLDDTLCEYRRPGSEVLTRAFERIGVEALFPIEAFNDRFDEFVEAGDDIRDIRRRAFGQLAEQAGHDRSTGHAIATAYETERDHSNVRFLPGAQRALETVGDRYRIGMVTNGDPWMQSQKLAGLGIADRFETVIHGGHDAAYKPDPDPFDTALEEMGVTRDRTIHIGNSLEADVAGALAAGLQVVWVANGNAGIDPDPQPHYVAETMADVASEPWA